MEFTSQLKVHYEKDFFNRIFKKLNIGHLFYFLSTNTPMIKNKLWCKKGKGARIKYLLILYKFERERSLPKTKSRIQKPAIVCLKRRNNIKLEQGVGGGLYKHI